MPYEFSENGNRVYERVLEFMDQYIYPNEERYYRELEEVGRDGWPPVLTELCRIAKKENLWNLFLPELDADSPGTKLTNLDFARVSEQLGKVWFGVEALNSSAPDSGNMEILHHWGSERIKETWLKPMLEGQFDSAFSMTEPHVASSDPLNLATTIERDGDEYVINGTKWFTSGGMADRCRFFIVMGITDPEAEPHRRFSMIVVPRDNPGVSFGREPKIYGFEHRGGHPEVIYDDVRVPVDNILGAEGDGFAIAQGRLGPGRIHHCMRQIGVAERALELMIKRAKSRSTFGSPLVEKENVRDWIAESRIEIDMVREYVYKAAHMMDTVGNKGAASEIAGIKVAVPNVVTKVIDRAIQVHGAAGVTQFTPLAEMWGVARILRIADGPDEVHKRTVTRTELRKYRG